MAVKSLDIAGTVLCEQCAAACCRYIALPIDKPKTRRDYDDIRWYVMHENVSVFVEDGDWYIQFHARCKNLREDNLCNVYDTRPKICSEYEAHDCDYAGGAYSYEKMFTHASQVENYARDKLGTELGQVSKPKRTKPKRKSAKAIAGAVHVKSKTANR